MGNIFGGDFVFFSVVVVYLFCFFSRTFHFTHQVINFLWLCTFNFAFLCVSVCVRPFFLFFSLSLLFIVMVVVGFSFCFFCHHTIYWYCRTLKLIEFNWWTMTFIRNEFCFSSELRKNQLNHTSLKVILWLVQIVHFALDLCEDDWTKAHRYIYCVDKLLCTIWIIDTLNSFSRQYFYTYQKMRETMMLFSIDITHLREREDKMNTKKNNSKK